MRRRTGSGVRPGSARSWWARRSVWLMMAVLTLGSTGTALAAAALHRGERDRVARDLTQQTSLVSTLVNGEIRRYTGFLTDLAAGLGAQARIEAAEFTAMTGAAGRERLPGASGVSFVVPAGTDRIAQVERFWRGRGAANLTLRQAGASAEHRFIVLTRTFGAVPRSAGRDISASPEASEALDRARATGLVAASRTYRLLSDALLPADQQQLSFVFAAPVVSTSPSADDTGRFRGWLVMGLRGADFLRQTIGLAAGDTVAVTLSDGVSPGSTQVAGWQPKARLDTAYATRFADVAAPQRTWRLAVRPTERLLPGLDRHRGSLALLVGATITVLLAILTRILLTSRDRALRDVAAATAALRDDILRREAVESQLRHREAELRGFAGVVAHDLRNPLARISGYADVLRESATALPAQERQFLDRLRAGAQQMQSLIDDLLAYATADNRHLEPVPVDLNDLVGTLVHDRHAPGRSAAPVITAGPLPRVDGDPTLLRQVFDNLIGNAVKYCPPGRTPRVDITAAPLDDSRWRIEVRDNGIGVPAEQRTSIFDAFVRAEGSQSFPGTGLGLAIVHRIVERHGGDIGVSDNPGGGSIFWINLPRTPAGPARQALPLPDGAVLR